MQWTPEVIWQDLEVFVIGGGDSLRSFDFGRLVGEKTVGCNNAYQHGPRICNICIFGDANWFKVHQSKLAEYVEAGGFVVTNDNKLALSKVPWLNWIERRPRGLHHKHLTWCTNTGAAAINLALILGAAKVYLLGFDRHLSTEGKPNWHDHQIDKPDAYVYERMNNYDAYMKRALPKKFPGKQIINVNDNSGLKLWPKISGTQFWADREKPNVQKTENIGCVAID